MPSASSESSTPLMRSSVERVARETNETNIMVAIKKHEIFRPSGRSQIFISVVYTKISVTNKENNRAARVCTKASRRMLRK